MGHMACAQWSQSGKFQLYDYGSSAANRAHYGVPAPPDIAGNYKLLDIPVDIMAGTSAGGQPHVSASLAAYAVLEKGQVWQKSTGITNQVFGVFAGRRPLAVQRGLQFGWNMSPCKSFLLPYCIIQCSSVIVCALSAAGRADGVIARENVLEHYAHMRDAGLNVTYKEFEAFGHLDFTFAIKDDLRHYVLSRLLLRH